jgi:hypothetical protein
MVRAGMRGLGRILCLLATVAFAANVAAPGLFHGCGATHGLAAVWMDHGSAAHDATHAHAPATPRPGSSGGDECHCVGDACCSAAAVLPTLPTLAAPTVITTPSAPPTIPLRLIISRPPHLLPAALAPPRWS